MSATRQRTGSPVSLALLLGWLIPGAGHLITRHWIRAFLLFASITVLWWMGIAMDGHLFQPGGSGVLDLLSFIGQLGSGLYYAICYFLGIGQTITTTAVEDYGSKFIIVASLLNVVAAVDAHNLSIGRKPSGVLLQASTQPLLGTIGSGYTQGIPSAAVNAGPVAPVISTPVAGTTGEAR